MVKEHDAPKLHLQVAGQDPGLDGRIGVVLSCWLLLWSDPHGLLGKLVFIDFQLATYTISQLADYDIYCERGFYNLDAQRGNFNQNALINYNQKIIEGDSLYFENEREYAAAKKACRYWVLVKTFWQHYSRL